MSSVAYVEIYALFGGTKLTQNLRAGTKFNSEDWMYIIDQFTKTFFWNFQKNGQFYVTF